MDGWTEGRTDGPMDRQKDWKKERDAEKERVNEREREREKGIKVLFFSHKLILKKTTTLNANFAAKTTHKSFFRIL